MEVRVKHSIGFWVFRALCFSLLSLLFLSCDARRTMLQSKEISNLKNSYMKHLKILEIAKNLNMVMDVSLRYSSSDPQSPLTLPPYDSLSPIPLPEYNSPPFCVYPPPPPQSPLPSPIGYSPIEPTLSPPSGPIQTTPPPLSIIPSPPTFLFGPPTSIPSPIEPIFSPPSGPIQTTPPPLPLIPSPLLFGPPTSIPSPNSPVPTPPYYEPSPPSGGYNPSPPVFQPPVVFPPPMALRPPPRSGGGGGGQRIWCVAKPSVPDPILQEAMNYACGSGADCGPIQPNGMCFQPNSPLAHASYAFNSYWQRTKVAGGTCEFGGIAMLVTMDPGSQGCHFMGN